MASSTILEQPAIVNDILITQAGVGTDQLGRFDIVVDDDTNSIVEWEWQLLPVDENLAEPDAELQKFIDSFQEKVDRKYKTLLCRFARELTHPIRNEETLLGNLFTDILADKSQSDVCLINSGSIRGTKLGPIVTLGDFRKAFPYDSPAHKLVITGKQLTDIFRYTLAPEKRARAIFQVNKSVKVVYNDTLQDVESLTVHGVPVEDDKHYSICLQDYYYKNSEAKLAITEDALKALGGAHVATTSIVDVIEEYLRSHQNLNHQIEGRVLFNS